MKVFFSILLYVAWLGVLVFFAFFFKQEKNQAINTIVNSPNNEKKQLSKLFADLIKGSFKAVISLWQK